MAIVQIIFQKSYLQLWITKFATNCKRYGILGGDGGALSPLPPSLPLTPAPPFGKIPYQYFFNPLLDVG